MLVEIGKNIKKKGGTKMYKGIFIACIIFVIITIIFNIWLGITYGNTPAREVPFWVFWVMS